jgi:hypothetical protein
MKALKRPTSITVEPAQPALANGKTGCCKIGCCK